MPRTGTGKVSRRVFNICKELGLFSIAAKLDNDIHKISVSRRTHYIDYMLTLVQMVKLASNLETLMLLSTTPMKLSRSSPTNTTRFQQPQHQQSLMLMRTTFMMDPTMWKSLVIQHGLARGLCSGSLLAAFSLLLSPVLSGPLFWQGARLVPGRIVETTCSMRSFSIGWQIMDTFTRTRRGISSQLTVGDRGTSNQEKVDAERHRRESRI